MKVLVSLALVAAVSAFPNLGGLQKRDYAQPGCTTSKLCNTVINISNQQANIPSTPNAFTEASAARTNCGAGHVCLTFDPTTQYVSTTGNNAYQSPSATDIRGPCPGLNAAANHNYLPRNGLATITQTIEGLGALYGMEADLAGFLAAYSIAFDGDVATGQWSIGGPLPKTVLSPLLGQAQGDGYSHNNYEGDTSIGRCDAYTNGGDAHSLSITRYNYAYAAGMDDDRYTLDKFSQLYAKNTHRSIQSNAYYFAPLFSTTLVSPAAYNFVINFMSNHSAAEPAGYLDGSTFNSFFGVSGEYPNFKWNKGQERVPPNWYKRPVLQQYSAVDVFNDLIPEFLAYPDSFRFGGNTNGVNTYTGIDIANFTGGAYNAKTLFEGDNFACFFFQSLQQGIPLQLQNGVNDVAAAVALITKYIPSFVGSLSCPQIGKYDSSVFTQYTGNGYKPSAPQSGPVNC